MSNQKGNSKRQRKHKISEGIHGATKHPLSELEKVLLGKGQMVTMTEVPCKAPWKGVAFVGEPYDARAVAENKILYPHLFREDDR